MASERLGLYAKAMVIGYLLSGAIVLGNYWISGLWLSWMGCILFIVPNVVLATMLVCRGGSGGHR